MIDVKLTYKFNNDEKVINIDRKEYLNPDHIEVYAREGDTIYVNDGDYVYINQLIKESSNGIKSYATVSGNVSIENDVITITNDSTDSSFVSSKARETLDEIKKEDIIKITEELGIEYENKLIVDKLKGNSKVLVVNAMDIEPYQFNNNYLFEEYASVLLDTIDLLSKRFNIDAYLLLNKYDDNNIRTVKELIGKHPDINFKVINDVFPFNTNPLIAKKFFNDLKYEDIMFLDSFALYKIYYAIKNELPVDFRYVTVCLPEQDKAYVIKSKYGVNTGSLINETIGNITEGKDVYLNNFMRKVKCPNISSLIVTDNIRTIFVMEYDDRVVNECIRCGKCVDICPVKINPKAKKLDSACIRCGLCNYVCPANINLIGKEK